MTILFAGHEMGAFVPYDANSTEDVVFDGFWDHAYSRCHQRQNGPSGRCRSATFSGTSEGYAHLTLETSLSGYGFPSVTLLRSDGTEVVRLYHNAGKLFLDYYNGSTWIGATPAGVSIGETARNELDIGFKTNSASGYLRLYSSGTLVLDSGVIDLSGVAAITNGMIHAPPAFITGTFFLGVSQVVISSEPTIGWRVGTTYPSAAGTTNTFTTGLYSDVDEIAYSDADGLTSDTANQIATFAGTTILPAGFACKGLAVTVRAKRGATGPQNMQIAIRTHATNYFSSTIALDVGYGAYCYVWETNPNTGVAWTDAEIAAVEIGVKSIA